MSNTNRLVHDPVQETQFGCDHELDIMTTACYMSPPDSSPHSDQRASLKSTFNPPARSLNATVMKAFPPVKRRRQLCNLDATFSQLEDDRQDADYIPTQMQHVTPPSISKSRVHKTTTRRGRLVSPEVGENRMITDFFLKVERPSTKQASTVDTTDIRETPKTPTKPRSNDSSSAVFKTPKRQIQQVVPSTTPGLSPISKSLAWRFETSPTPKKNMKERPISPVLVRRKRLPFVVPSSQWDDAELEELQIHDHSDVSDSEHDNETEFHKSASESLASNSQGDDDDDDEEEEEEEMTREKDIDPPQSQDLSTLPKPFFFETTISSRESTPSQVVHCGQQTGASKKKAADSAISLREEDVWTAKREELDYLMGASCDELDEEISQSKMETWNSPKSSPVATRNASDLNAQSLQPSNAIASRMSSKADSIILSDAESENKLFFPATQQRPPSIAQFPERVSILDGDDDDDDTDHAYESCDEGLGAPHLPPPSNKPIQHSQHPHSKRPLSKQTPTSTTHSTQTPPHTQGSTLPSTQFYLDKLLTDSMLESLPMPEFATQSSSKSRR